MEREGGGEGKIRTASQSICPVFCPRGEREKEEGRGSARQGDKNSPNPSLITMPTKSEILTAAPRHIAEERRREERRTKRSREKERERDKERNARS